MTRSKLSTKAMLLASGIGLSLAAFAGSLTVGARVLDAGAGEGNYKAHFAAHRYCGLDLGIGDEGWDYSRLVFGRTLRVAGYGLKPTV